MIGNDIREIQQACPFSPLKPELLPMFNGGELLTDPALHKLNLFRGTLDSDSGTVPRFGCLELTRRDHPRKQELKRDGTEHGIPNLSAMLKQAERFRRITTNNPSQPNFVPRQVSEFEFKESYVKEAIQLGKRNHDISVDDMRKLLLGSYAIEGSGAITYDTQSGTKLKFTAPDQTGTNETERRNLKNPASTAIGYTQLLVSTDLHVIHDDNGAIVARLRDIGKDSKDAARAAEIEDKAKLFEILQSKLDDELKQFAKKDKTSMAAYLDSRGNLDVKSKIYADFAKSSMPTSLGMSCKQFASGLHALLLDGDVGPIVQARQLNEDIDHYLKIRRSSQESQETSFDKLSPKQKQHAIDALLAHTAYKKLPDEEKERLNESIKRLSPSPRALETTRKTLGVESEFYNAVVSDVETTLKKTPLLGLLIDKLKSQNHEPAALPVEVDPAAIETINVVGVDRAEKMFEHPQTPTRHFVSGMAYRKNHILQGTNAETLKRKFLLQMAKTRAPGTIEFESIFNQLQK